MIRDLSSKYSIQHWGEFRPKIPQYTKYSPNVILTALKIEDVFSQINNARLSLFLTSIDDYGPKIVLKSDHGLKRIRSKFLFDSLAYYNYAVDLSWQTLFLFYGSDSYEILLNKEKYYKALRDCTQENVNYYLRLSGDHKSHFVLNKFFSDSLTRELREAYNYIKHRGTFDVDEQISVHRFPLEIFGLEMRMATREVINLEDWQSKLRNFDIMFYNYFNSIISIMPNDFKNDTATIGDILNFLEKFSDNFVGIKEMEIEKMHFSIPGLELSKPND
ncbi:hypothetical protein P4H61_16640 [Paenibacillus peoriae]|uniref:hypothetical protein n=1 Tax=Paenibacillus peoriae TaxID=59893 RepID=UPI00026C616C|nr:hypothetical protein [Paenibacillus peoriae]MEC0183115.1 hypothetical protein [Paenibacillus peoriae]